MQHEVGILTAAHLGARMSDDGRSRIRYGAPYIGQLEMPHPSLELLARRIDREGSERVANHLIPELDPFATGYPIRAERSNGSGNTATYRNKHRRTPTNQKPTIRNS